MWVWLLIAVLAGVGITALVQFRATRRTYKPLSDRQPERRRSEVPLGLEAVDLDAVSRTTRRNESLERGQTNWLRNTGFFGRSDTEVTPLADDETYAARYHAAFQKPKSKD